MLGEGQQRKESQLSSVQENSFLTGQGGHALLLRLDVGAGAHEVDQIALKQWLPIYFPWQGLWKSTAMEISKVYFASLHDQLWVTGRHMGVNSVFSVRLRQAVSDRVYDHDDFFIKRTTIVELLLRNEIGSPHLQFVLWECQETVSGHWGIIKSPAFCVVHRCCPVTR